MPNKPSKVIKQTLDGDFICEYNSVQEASNIMGISTVLIYKGCNKGVPVKGYLWDYKRPELNVIEKKKKKGSVLNNPKQSVLEDMRKKIRLSFFELKSDRIKEQNSRVIAERIAKESPFRLREFIYEACEFERYDILNSINKLRRAEDYENAD